MIGRLVEDPQLRQTGNNNSVVNFSVAVTRKRGTEEYTSFFDCTAWGTLAENINASLHKGDRVVVNGNLNQDRWEDKEGATQRKVVINAEAVGPDLRFATAQVGTGVQDMKAKIPAEVSF